MRHALKEFSKALPRGEASMNLKRILYRKFFKAITNGSTPHPRYYSQHCQDRFIDNFLLHGKRNGVFVDIGAYDGVLLSNTYYFEKELGWNGICVEPNPVVYESLIQNRDCVSLNCGVAGEEGVLDFLKLPADLDLGSGFIQYFDDSSLFKDKKFINEIGARGGEIIKITSRDFNDLLRSHQITRIDYLSIDTEGADFQVLSSVDFDAFDIRVISIENTCFGDRIISFLSKRGYELKAILGNDEIYMKRNMLPEPSTSSRS
jgi:FkbM family methyltransferase